MSVYLTDTDIFPDIHSKHWSEYAYNRNNKSDVFGIWIE